MGNVQCPNNTYCNNTIGGYDCKCNENATKIGTDEIYLNIDKCAEISEVAEVTNNVSNKNWIYLLILMFFMVIIIILLIIVFGAAWWYLTNRKANSNEPSVQFRSSTEQSEEYSTAGGTPNPEIITNFSNLSESFPDLASHSLPECEREINDGQKSSSAPVEQEY